MSIVRAMAPRRNIAGAIYRSGLWRFYNPEPLVVSYHGIVEEIRDSWLEAEMLARRTFQEHLEYFQKHRIVVSLDELLQYVADGKTPDPRFVVLCFDDALASLRTYAVPELSARGMPFTIGVPAALPGTGRSLWEYEAAFLVYLQETRGEVSKLVRAVQQLDGGDETRQDRKRVGESSEASEALAMLKSFLRFRVLSSERIKVLADLIDELEPNFVEELNQDGRFSIMSWDDLRSACAAGGTLAAHGCFHHPHNETITASCRIDEFRCPKELIKQHAGVDVDSFIWPEGVVSDTSIRIGRDAGYKYFLSSRSGRVTEKTSTTDVPRMSGQWPLAQVLWNAARMR